MHQKILAKSKTEKYDFVFVIDGKQLPNFFLHETKTSKPKIKIYKLSLGFSKKK